MRVDRHVELRAELPTPANAPIAALSARRVDQFAIGTAAGQILVYEL